MEGWKKQRGIDGGPIAVLYPRARSTLYVNPVPYPRVTYIFARTWVRVCPDRVGWRFDETWGETLNILLFNIFSNQTTTLHVIIK